MSAFKMTHGGILPGSGDSNHTLIIIMEQYFRSFARERLPEADGGYPKVAESGIRRDYFCFRC